MVRKIRGQKDMNDGHLHHYKECNANGSEEVPVRYVLAGEAHRHLYSTNPWGAAVV